MSHVARTVTLLAITVLLLTTAIHAQQPFVALSADVPFEFSVGSHSFPAGQYWVTRIGPNGLALRDSDQHILTVTQTVPIQASGRRSAPALRFRLKDGHHVLAEIWPQGGHDGYQLPLPKPAIAVAQAGSGKTHAAAGSQANPAVSH